MAAAISLDVAHEIKVDHNNVRDLYQRYTAASDPADKTAIANTLIREMAIHGDAEEVSVYNEYSALSLGSTAVHNKEEHAEIKRLVYDADAARVDSPGYDGVLEKAVTAFLTHAKEEEDEQLPLIVSKLTPEENDVITLHIYYGKGKEADYMRAETCPRFPEGEDVGSDPSAPLGSPDWWARTESSWPTGCPP